MKLYFKDLVTDELFPVECQPTDTITNLKHHFLTYQPMPLSISELTVEFCRQKDARHIPQKENTTLSGTLEENGVEEYDLVLFIYPIE
jgi:hypothetical protein